MMMTINSNRNTPIFYKETGKLDGPALILLHSGGMSHSEWQPQLPLFEKYYHVICIDQPGHGASLMQATRLSIQECGLAVLNVMAQLQIEQAHFCGSSMGGATTLWLARHYPEKISKMILYRVNYRKNAGTFEQTNLMANPEYWQKVGLDGYLSKLHEAQGNKESWKQVVQRVSEALDPEHSDHNHTIADLNKMQMPCLIVCGDRDPLVPIADLLAMYAAFPHADLWIMPHASHVTATNTWRGNIFAEEAHRFLVRVRDLSL